MKELSKLWREHFCEDCMIIDTERERALSAELSAARKRLCEILTKEQERIIESYIETLQNLSSEFAEKAFIQGCKLATAILLNVLN